MPGSTRPSALGLIVATGVYRLYEFLEDQVDRLAARRPRRWWWPVFAWLIFRVVQFPPFAEFLIATEAEMNKVSWTSEGGALSQHDRRADDRRGDGHLPLHGGRGSGSSSCRAIGVLQFSGRRLVRFDLLRPFFLPPLGRRPRRLRRADPHGRRTHPAPDPPVCPAPTKAAPRFSNSRRTISEAHPSMSDPTDELAESNPESEGAASRIPRIPPPLPLGRVEVDEEAPDGAPLDGPHAHAAPVPASDEEEGVDGRIGIRGRPRRKTVRSRPTRTTSPNPSSSGTS